VLRGLFGLEWNAATRTLTVTPQLPADWKTATLRRIPLGNERVDLRFTRRGQEMVVQETEVSHSVRDADKSGARDVRLATRAARATEQGRTLRITLPDVEVAVVRDPPKRDAVTQQMKVLDERWDERSLTLTLAGRAGSTETLTLRENAPDLPLQCMNGKLGERKDGLLPVTVTFPPGSGYVTETVTFMW
jgi:hypothetical protein